MEIRTICETCNRYILNENYTHTINEGFNCYCKCEQPKFRFNKNVLKLNINSLILKIFTRLNIWGIDIYDTLITSEKNLEIYQTESSNEIDYNQLKRDWVKRNYCTNNLLLDVYNSIDMLKSHIYLLTKNIFLNKSIIDSLLKTDGVLAEIKKIETDYTFLKETIHSLQLKLNISQELQDKTSKRIDLLKQLSDSNYFKWIKRIRNKLTHNYLNIIGGTCPISELNELRKINGVYLLLVYIIYFFYTILDGFGCLA